MFIAFRICKCIVSRCLKNSSKPVALPDLYFYWSLYPVAAIVQSGGLLFLFYYLLFRSPITDLDWNATGWPKNSPSCISFRYFCFCLAMINLRARLTIEPFGMDRKSTLMNEVLRTKEEVANEVYNQAHGVQAKQARTSIPPYLGG